MSGRYILILVLYTLASFGTILAIAESALWVLRKQLVRIIELLRPGDGILANMAVRFLPPSLALVLTSFSAVPGYFHGEPVGTHEVPGPWLVALALFGLYSILAPLTRVAGLTLRTSSRTKAWWRRAIETETISNFPVLEVELPGAMLVASGVFRKSIFLSHSVRSLLSARELSAALRHEAAHCRQNHNFMKFMCAVAPHVLPTHELDDCLRESIEFAADDEACTVPGDALNLASAVVILAREAAARTPEMLFTSLVADNNTARLERRVERLVLPKSTRNGTMFSELAAGCAAILTIAAAVGLLPAAQHAFRETLELLVR